MMMSVILTFPSFSEAMWPSIRALGLSQDRFKSCHRQPSGSAAQVCLSVLFLSDSLSVIVHQATRGKAAVDSRNTDDPLFDTFNGKA